MLTKTRKWLLALVVAFAAVFLVACTPKVEEPKKAVPEDIIINVDAFVGSVDNYATVVGGDAMLLSVSSLTDNADLRVTWTTSDASKATVNQSGKVTGISGGTVTITASSLADGNANVKADLLITVYDSVELMENDLRVLMAAQTEIEAKIPAFIDGAVVLPQTSNNLITATYMDLDGNAFAGNKYPYSFTYDQFETIKIELAYKNEKIVFNYQLSVVEDAADNDFLAVAEAREAVAEYLAPYVAGEPKLFGDINLPKTLSELNEWFNREAPERDVEISWVSTDTNTVSNTGVFNRPNDDKSLVLEAFYIANRVTGVDRIRVNVKGYTPDEIIEEILAPLPTSLQAKNINLPTYDSKFGASIVWVSDKPEIISNNGKSNAYITEKETVTFTATIKYFGSGSKFEFEKTVTFEVEAIPAEKPVQAVALDLNNQYEELIPAHFPFGQKGRVDGNKLVLPTVVGGEGEFKDVVVTWGVEEADLFDAEWNLVKQYLRYHKVNLTFEITVGTDTVTSELPINVGIAAMENTIYAGGNHYARTTANHPTQIYDELQQLSGFDGPMGTLSSSYNTNGWTGVTFYRDVTDEVSGAVTRYQYFGARRYEVVLTADGTYTFDENGILNGGAKTAIDATGFENRQQTIVNLSGQDVKIPLQITTVAARLVNPEAAAYPATNVALSMAGIANADGGLNLKAYRTGFVTDGEGNIVIGSGDKTIQDVLFEANLALEEPLEVLPNYVNLPNGAVAYSKGDVGTASLATLFSVLGGKLGIESYEVHPANIIA
jgi:hypothetical protein